MIGVPEVESQVEDLGSGLREELRCHHETRLCDQQVVAGPGFTEPALHGANAEAEEIGGLPDGRIVVVGGQCVDHLADGAHEIAVR